MTSHKHGIVCVALSCFLVMPFAACGGGGGGGSGPDASPVGHPGTVNGLVTDIGTGARVSGASVSGGGMTTTTDEKGEFTLTGLQAGDVSLSFDKTGYAPGFAIGNVGDNAAAVVIALKQQGSPQPYQPTAAQTLSERTEAGPYAVVFQANSLDTTDTNLTVSITPLDPTKERQALPGSLVTGGANPVPLIPVTFAEFTILDSSGQRVQLKPSASATVELPIPPALRSAYPDGTRIHCYAYDATTGKWEDFVDGIVQTSSVDGTSPVLAAAIRHFSWYGGAPQGTNCVDVYVSVVSAVDGRPLPNARVEATPGTVAYTDGSGSALVQSAIGNTSSTYTAYQTGYDVDGSLTGIPGAKYIEFGQVQEDLVGLVQRPCGSSLRPAAIGEEGNPVVIKVGLIEHLLYEASAILTAGQGGSNGSVAVSLQAGVPGPDGQLENPMAASGAIITLAQSGQAPVTLTELAAGTGFYASVGTLTITPGESYALAIDGDGNGSFEGMASVVAVGELAWLNPSEGANVAATGFIARWSDSGSAAGNAAYAPVYSVSLVANDSSDVASYVGTEPQFAVTSALNPGLPLAAGSYTASLLGFSGFLTAGGGLQVSNNITGTGVTGTFFSISQAAPVTFTVH